MFEIILPFIFPEALHLYVVMEHVITIHCSAYCKHLPSEYPKNVYMRQQCLECLEVLYTDIYTDIVTLIRHQCADVSP